MSNEELAIRAKSGDADAILLLWNAVERFVIVMAEKYSIANEKAAETEDLISAGYLAVCKAVEYFNAERGTAFLTLLGYCLKGAFAEASGIRSTKRDALLYCDSLNTPAFQGDSDSGEQLDYIEDDAAEQPYNDIEQADFMQYTRSVIAAALETLEPMQRALLIDKYINNKSWKYCVSKYEFGSRSAASDAAERAAYKLEFGRYGKQLRECLDEFNEYNGYKQAAQNSGLGTFYRYGVSLIEAVTLLKDGGFENE